MKKVYWIITAASVACILLFIGVIKIINVHRDRVAAEQDTVQLAAQNATKGVMPAADYIRLDSIQSNTRSSGSISSEDLAWVLQFLRSHTSAGFAGQQARSDALFALEGLKKITPLQENEIYTAVLPLLRNTPVYNDDTDKVRAASLMGVLKDPRATPYLKYLQQQHQYSPILAERCKIALEKMSLNASSGG